MTKKIIIAILICEAAGIIGAFFTTPAIATWYSEIRKPNFVPPDWLFAPAWTTLFLLMGISAGIIWNRGLGNKNIKTALSIFGVQLASNILWSLLFFGLKSPFLAFLEIILLWLAILINIISFYKISKTAGLLLLPYILWVSFAALLNFSVWQLNS